MACEVAASPCGWMFVPEETFERIFDAAEAKGGTREVWKNLMAQMELPFQFTPLHDLEPLLWMIVWICEARPSLGGALTQAQTESFNTIFHGEVFVTGELCSHSRAIQQTPQASGTS
jgi:hypothetical protein